jgi:1-acyl-sn-glycerol-3-phosphate acyltransferase
MRTAWVILNALVATPPLSLVIIVAAVFGAPASFHDRIGQFWCRWMLWASGVTVHAFGTENIAAGRPQILVSNHVSFYDVLALAVSVPKRFRFVGKRELTRVPLWGRAWQAAGHIAIDRSDRQRAVASLDRAGRVVREDRSCIIMFPEGTRSVSGRLQPFKKGAFMLALHTGIEIVPVAVRGSGRVLPKSSWRVRSAPIIVRFGAPLATAGYSEATREDLMTVVRSEMETLLSDCAVRNEKGQCPS